MILQYAILKPLEFIDITPVKGTRQQINSYSWRSFVNIWCRFRLEYISDESFRELEEVQNMPSYHDDGSIRIIDNTVVVKF